MYQYVYWQYILNGHLPSTSQMYSRWVSALPAPQSPQLGVFMGRNDEGSLASCSRSEVMREVSSPSALRSFSTPGKLKKKWWCYLHWGSKRDRQSEKEADQLNPGQRHLFCWGYLRLSLTLDIRVEDFFSLRGLAEIWALENYQLRNRPNVEKLICINHKP